MRFRVIRRSHRTRSVNAPTAHAPQGAVATPPSSDGSHGAAMQGAPAQRAATQSGATPPPLAQQTTNPRSLENPYGRLFTKDNTFADLVAAQQQ